MAYAVPLALSLSILVNPMRIMYAGATNILLKGLQVRNETDANERISQHPGVIQVRFNSRPFLHGLTAAGRMRDAADPGKK